MSWQEKDFKANTAQTAAKKNTRTNGRTGSKKRSGSRLIAITWIAFAIELLALIAVTVYIGILSFLPAKFFIGFIFAWVVVCGIQFLMIRLQKRPAGSSILSIILSVIFIVMSGSIFGVLRFVYSNYANTNKGANQTKIVMSVYVRKDSGYKDLGDLKEGIFGIRDEAAEDSIERAVGQIEKLLGQSITIRKYTELADQISGLKNGDVDAIILNQALIEAILENVDSTFEQWAEPLSDQFEVENKVDTNTANVAVEPFLVYISGLDTRGDGPIRDSGLSDVNMIAAVNPITKQILLVNTPRDFYVGLYGDSSKMDKLTHAGMSGINCSMDTLEALYGIDFNYYVKVNFMSVVRIVDALGGIIVYSDYEFSGSHSFDGNTKYYFQKGENYLNGDQALTFARERYAFAAGDRQRGKNQQKIISAVIDKITSPAIISNFGGALTAITDNTKTNISSTEINALIKLHLDYGGKWNTQTFSVTGSDSYQSTYSMGSQKLYVMIPDMNTVAEARALIQAVLDAR